MKVLESERLLFCRDEIYLADFKGAIIRRYCNIKPDLRAIYRRAIYRDYDQGLQEEYL